MAVHGYERLVDPPFTDMLPPNVTIRSPQGDCVPNVGASSVVAPTVEGGPTCTWVDPTFGRGQTVLADYSCTDDVPVWTLDEYLRFVPGVMTHVFSSGVKPTFELRLASGRVVTASANHPFLTVDGWVPLADLAVGDRLAVRPTGPDDPTSKTVPVDVATYLDKAAAERGLDAAALLAEAGASGARAGVARRALRQVTEKLDDPWLRDLVDADVLWDTVSEIVPLGPKPVYDATVVGTHNFVANGIVAHNSIEQDSDVVMFIYRDDIYNEDSPDRGTAEIIVVKHRSGPTDKVRLAFLGHHTRFENMARGA